MFVSHQKLIKLGDMKEGLKSGFDIIHYSVLVPTMLRHVCAGCHTISSSHFLYQEVYNQSVKSSRNIINMFIKTSTGIRYYETLIIKERLLSLWFTFLYLSPYNFVRWREYNIREPFIL